MRCKGFAFSITRTAPREKTHPSSAERVLECFGMAFQGVSISFILTACEAGAPSVKLGFLGVKYKEQKQACDFETGRKNNFAEFAWPWLMGKVPGVF